ncbi:hypothetical protein D3C80_1652440 [compost metagenome]
MRPEHQPKACFGEVVGWTRSVQPSHRVAWDTCPPRKGVDKCQASTPQAGPHSAHGQSSYINGPDMPGGFSALAARAAPDGTGARAAKGWLAR